LIYQCLASSRQTDSSFLADLTARLPQSVRRGRSPYDLRAELDAQRRLATSGADRQYSVFL
jgi:hypothetical protein